MTKREEIKKHNQIREASGNLRQMALQVMALATHLESEANSALEKLGVSSGRSRKAKHQLSPELKTQVLGGLTKIKKRM